MADSPSTVRLRIARADDFPACMRLWHQLQEIQGTLRPLKATRDPDELFQAEFEDSVDRDEWLVAEVRGVVVAMAHMHPDTPSRVTDEVVLELKRVSVDADHRGLGIGTALVAHAEDLARSRGIRYLSAKIFTGNPEAMRFWEREHFEPYVEVRLRKIGD